MSRPLAASGAAVIAVLIPMLAHAGTVPAAPHVRPAPTMVAPADEYFGRMKMSILGITNSIRDTATREGFDPANASRYYGSLALTEDALEDWAHKYPQDSWIPRRAYDISHDFWLMHTPQADGLANRCRWLLFMQFPRDHWTTIARHESAAIVAPMTAIGPAAGATADQQH
jgi:hypothetical protein